MNWQDWIIAILIPACFIFAGYRFFHFLRSTDKGDNPCAGCATGCELREMMDKKQQQCRRDGKVKGKNCCH